MRRWAIALLMLLAVGCRQTGGGTDRALPDRVDPARYDAFFLWAGVHPSPALAKARTIYLLNGEVRARGAPHFTLLLAQTPHVTHARLWLTVRLERLDWSEAVYRRVLNDLDSWRVAGNDVAGLTLDFDTNARGLAGYAAFLKGMRARLPAHYRLSVTGLLDWSAHADPAALAALAPSVDEAIIQTYQGRHTIPGYERWFGKVARLPLPFRVALVEGGAWRAPPGLDKAPGFRGYVVFLLPASRSAVGADAIARGARVVANTQPSAPRAIPPVAIAQGWWHIGPIEALDAFQAPAWLPPLPRPGSTLRIAGAQVCYHADDCSDLKLERQKLADGPGQDRLPALLGLAPDWPFYAVSLNDRAAFGLVRRRDGTLIALSDACDDSGEHCGFVRQVWTAIPDGAR